MENRQNVIQLFYAVKPAVGVIKLPTKPAGATSTHGQYRPNAHPKKRHQSVTVILYNM